MNLKDYLFEYVLSLADNAFIQGRRISEWSGKGPFLEEDIVLTKIALDLIGRSRRFYDYVSAIEGKDRTEDDYVYGREASEYRNFALAEQPNDNFAHTITRQFLLDAYQLPLFEELRSSSDSALALISIKAYDETRFHYAHSSEWMMRMGAETKESSENMQQALNDLWPYAAEMFYTFDEDAVLAGHGIMPAPESLKNKWLERVTETLNYARLKKPANDERTNLCGRKGVHTEKLGSLLAEMQFLPRAYPGARWW
jgi:ring-1,2-phenylacetyl-CoA epoxidase subunit PaaC